MNKLNTHNFCKIPHMICCKSIRKHRVVSTAGINPSFSRSLKARKRLPKNTCNRKIRHIINLLLTLYIVNYHPEPVTHINKGYNNCITCLCLKHKSCRIFPVTYTKRMNLNFWFFGSNAWTNFKHM